MGRWKGLDGIIEQGRATGEPHGQRAAEFILSITGSLLGDGKQGLGSDGVDENEEQTLQREETAVGRDHLAPQSAF